MSARLLRAGIVAAAVLAAAFLLALLAGIGLTTRQRRLDPLSSNGAPATATGAFHVHTSRSDGSGTPDEIAAAAARAGLHFLIFTDHGDGTLESNQPQYRAGVLCVDAVEISTASGHYIALGLPPAPYPLGGEARDVVEDVARLGGFGVIAHPESPKPTLRWNEWTAPFDGMEWLNADSEWRDEQTGSLVRAVMGYAVRPVETVASLLDRPEGALRRMDTIAQQRRVVSLAGVDAHGRIGLRSEESDAALDRWFLRLPSYDVAFRTFTTRVNLARPFSGDAGTDAASLIRALRGGETYTAIDAVASPALLQFSATAGPASAQQGGLIQSGAPLELSVRSNGPPDSTITVVRNGTVVTTASGPDMSLSAGSEPGVFRVEVALPNAPGGPPVPWLLSNPIWVQPSGWPSSAVSARQSVSDSLAIGAEGWHLETDPSSAGQIVPSDNEWLVGLRYRLGEAAGRSPYSALALSTGSALVARDRLSFRASASQPMRVSVQARRRTVGERWQRSIYLDAQPRDVVILFDDMRPVAATSTSRFDPADVDTVLFVVDTINTRPRSEGTFRLGRVALER